ISLYSRELPGDVIHTLDFHNDIARIILKDPVTKSTGTGGDILKAREQRVEKKEKELSAEICPGGCSFSAALLFSFVIDF
ncbi:MAG: hypothetical protein IKV96_04350, partial [Firmicutes bacterium]|nr:hypothetical protein [Bacillota bacterium]